MDPLLLSGIDGVFPISICPSGFTGSDLALFTHKTRTWVRTSSVLDVFTSVEKNDLRIIHANENSPRNSNSNFEGVVTRYDAKVYILHPFDLCHRDNIYESGSFRFQIMKIEHVSYTSLFCFVF